MSNSISQYILSLKGYFVVTGRGKYWFMAL